MRPNDRTEREALNDAGLRVRMVGQQLKSENINPNAPITRDVFLATMDMLKDELGKLSLRIGALEAEAAKPRHTMTFAGDWIEGFEYSDGDVVLYGDSMFVAVQPREPASPPSRYTGWVQLTGA